MPPRRTTLLSLSTLFAGLALTACGSAPTAEVGDCLNTADLSDPEIVEITPVPCEHEHDAEVYYTFDLPEGDFPGDEAVIAAAEDGCHGAFEGYVGSSYEESAIYFTFLHPSEQGWRSASDREVICVLQASEPVTGSLQDSGL